MKERPVMPANELKPGVAKFTKTFIPRRQFKHNPQRLNVLSSGGGTQSNAIICLIHAGALPKPDVIVMSDTEREASNVFAYQPSISRRCAIRLASNITSFRKAFTRLTTLSGLTKMNHCRDTSPRGTGVTITGGALARNLRSAVISGSAR